MRGHPRAAIVQLFNWPFKRVARELRAVQRLGYDLVLISPPQLSAPQGGWGFRYQPHDYRLLLGPLGSPGDLERVFREARRLKLGILVDVVLRHMAMVGDGELVYPHAVYQEHYGLSRLFGPEHFHPRRVITDYSDKYQLTHHWISTGPSDPGLPALNHDHPHVFDAQRAYLRRLVRLGAAGFRIDAAKHIPADYLSKLLEAVDPGRKLFVVAENLSTSPDLLHIDLLPYLGVPNLRFYDFPLLHRLLQAFRPGGSLRALEGPGAFSLDSQRSVSFVVNHDLPNNGEMFRGLLLEDPRDEALAFAYLFARRDGTPLVYSDQGTRDGSVESGRRYERLHARRDLRAMVDFRRATLEQPERWVHLTDDQVVLARGQVGLFALNKGRAPWALENVAVPVTDGTFRDLLTGRRLRVVGGRIARLELGEVSAGLFVRLTKSAKSSRRGR